MTANIKELFIFLIIFSTFLAISLELSAKEKEKDTGLLLAKSFWGECGADCSEEEKNIIYNIYKKRQVNWKLYDVILSYSGAVKKRKNHKQKWIHHLNRDGDKPKKWDKNLKWENHKKLWLDLIDSADYLLEYNPPDLCPECVHYCGRFERNIVSNRMIRVKLKLKNDFWKWKVKK